MKPVVTEQTSKRYKGRMLAGAVVACVGVVMMVGNETPFNGALVMVAGIAIYVWGRFSAWWNNG